ncbi:hypothetical protein [Legionella quinlivanii]|uniref:hypothetical protein n=1 Tax=Legionella quinlivanii TaxID=45073 RepID=UPI002242ED87|nr:hypothetical protein [Legionella quinlivanii]MCW8450620.1 hypothetical protein [Legionella quinlivanii]
MSKIWQLIKGMLIVQEALAQFMQRSVAKLIKHHYGLFITHNAYKKEGDNLKIDYDLFNFFEIENSSKAGEL